MCPTIFLENYHIQISLSSSDKTERKLDTKKTTKKKQHIYVKQENVPDEGQGHMSNFVCFFFFIEWEDLVTRNLHVHVKYESSI